MSDDKNLPAMPFADFTIKDLETIDKFKEDGMLGLHTLVETDVERMMGLYMDGNTYRQISQITKKNKAVVLFLAHKFNWFELRKEYLDELVITLKEKVLDSKIQDQQFLLHLSRAYRKKIGKNVDQYLRTDDPTFSDRIDQKDIATYLKIADMLHSLSDENLRNPNESKPLVGLNGMGEGVIVTKTGENSVEITPKVSQFSSKLKQFADMKREQEKTPKVPRDIVVNEPSTKKESESKNE